MKSSQKLMGEFFEYEPGRLTWGCLSVELTPDGDMHVSRAMQADDVRRLQYLFYYAQVQF